MEEQSSEVTKVDWRKIFYIMPVVWLTLILVTLHSTNPLKVGPAGTLLLFLLVYTFLVSLLFIVIKAFIKVWQLATRQKNNWPLRTSYFLASMLAVGPIFMIALNTLGQLGLVEVILVLLLVATGSFYILRRTTD
ncbi:MAG TPA: hypothetical protein VFT87_04740 [Candidatus Saccharimonadales bacterium]|nr:hypothetical protein [Candidatus Saccharimonadales bacterium]